MQEVAWYADDNERVLGILQFYPDDEDWAFTVLGRDERGMFRAIDLGVSIATRVEAVKQLEQCLDRPFSNWRKRISARRESQKKE